MNSDNNKKNKQISGAIKYLQRNKSHSTHHHKGMRARLNITK